MILMLKEKIKIMFFRFCLYNYCVMFKYLIGQGVVSFGEINFILQVVKIVLDLNIFEIYVIDFCYIEFVMGVNGQILLEDFKFEILFFLEYCFLIRKLIVEVIKICYLGFFNNFKL